MRKPSRVFQEWDKLVFDFARPPEVKEPEWRALYESCFENGSWGVDEFDAGLVTNLGVTLMLQLSRWKEASQILEDFTEHPAWPGLEQGDCIIWSEMMHRLGQSKLLEGRTAEAISLFDQVLDTKGPLPQSVRRHLVRNSIVELCRASPRETRLAFPELAQLAGRTLADWPGQKSKAKGASAAKSPKELAKVLESTYPPREDRGK